MDKINADMIMFNQIESLEIFRNFKRKVRKMQTICCVMENIS